MQAARAKSNGWLTQHAYDKTTPDGRAWKSLALQTLPSARLRNLGWGP